MSYASLEAWAGRRSLMLAIVFTDIVGSTILRKELGDERMAAITRQHFAKATHYINQHEGFRIKTNGDEVMSVFWTAIDALNYVLNLSGDTGDERVSIRSAIHVGTVSIIDGDIDATMAAIVARIMKTSKEASITMSEDAYVQIHQVRSERHAGLTIRRRRVTLEDFPEIISVRTILPAKTREQFKRRFVATTTKPDSSLPIPDRPLVRRQGVPPLGAERRERIEVGQLTNRHLTRTQRPKLIGPEILTRKLNSASDNNNVLPPLWRDIGEEKKK